MTEPTDAEVISRSLADPQAFAVVFDRHVAAVHGYLSRRGGTECGDSLTGEVFRIAFETRGRYAAQYPSALPWLYGIAANVLRQDTRSQRRRARLFERLVLDRPPKTVWGSDPQDQITTQGDVSEALAALTFLPMLDREALLLFTWEQMSYEEIASALGIRLGTVRSRLHRARKRVREQLALAGHEEDERSRQPDRRCS